MADDVQRQREYYARTAHQYDALHLGDDDEHALALAAFAGIARLRQGASVLDVGAGTGRALAVLAMELPGAQLVGIEPVAELREIGHRKGIAPEQLIEGDAHHLPFADDSFDFVIETGVLHHVPDPGVVVGEMARVARLGVLLSDSNKFGQGSRATRLGKALIDRLGLWRAMIWLTTRGRMAKWSEGDGVFYSYSAFDNLAQLERKFPFVMMLNTVPASGPDLKRGAAQVALLALKR